MKAMSIVLFVLLLVTLAHAQQRWERTYGGAESDGSWSVRQTTDGGYIVAGFTYFGNVSQVFLIKTNASGDTLWTRHIWRGSGSECGRSVQQTFDGGYIIGGWINYYGTYQVYLIKTNASGDTLWTRDYGERGSDFGFSVQQTSDTGYILAGEYDYSGFTPQAYLIRTNATGDTLWTRTYGGADWDGGNSVQQTADGGYIVAGWTWSYGNSRQAYLIKTNASGDTLWTRTYGGTGLDDGKSVQQTSDGGYILAGATDSFGDTTQVYLIKTNSNGDTLWTRTYGGIDVDVGHSVQQTTDGGYIVAGYSFSFGYGDQVYLIKTNASGDTLWTRTYGGIDWEESYSVQQTSDGGYIVTGYTGSFGSDTQVYLIKTDSSGRSSGVEENAEVRGQRLEVRIKATPNPFTSFATLPGHEAERFSLYDVSGRKVGTYRGDRVGEGLAPGVYFLRPEQGSLKPLRIVKLR